MRNSDLKTVGLGGLAAVILIACALVLSAAVLAGIHGGKVKARNAQRAEDVKVITQALKLYYEYNQKYPEAVGGLPQDITSYLSSWPKAPTPPDGSCTAQQNSYVYSQAAAGESYRLGFCLSKGAGGYRAGYQEVSP